VVPGGKYNYAGGAYSFAAGQKAKATNDGTFVWSDSQGTDFSSTTNNQFLIRAQGGVGIGTNNPQSTLHVNGTVTATSFTGSGAGLTGLNASNLTGTASSLSATNLTILGAITGNGANVTNVNAAALNGLTSDGFWKTSGNTGANPAGGAYLGTADNQPLEFKVNGSRVLRLEPNGSSPNVVGGYSDNLASNGVVGAFIGGGGTASHPNRVGGLYASVLGGYNSTASGNYSTASGFYATASGYGATAMGYYATASGYYSTALGFSTTASGSYSTALGDYARATNTDSFVWSDGTAYPGASSTNDNSVTFRASGGYRFFSNSGMTAGAYLAPGGTAWATISDQNAKKNFRPVNSGEILDKLATVPVQKWNYQWEKDSDVPNIGPMAQAFKAAFYPGRDDKSITTLEFDGVELAAIQGLNEKLRATQKALEEKDARIGELEKRLTDLERVVQSLAPKK
jgi:hypothetical protein